MPWTPLADRLHELPLILAGPILRRTEPDAVTVWVALKDARDPVTLEVSRTKAREGRPEELDQQPVLRGLAPTVRLGQRLHVVAVTAVPTSPTARLRPGEIYAYNMAFGTEERLVGGLRNPLNTAFTSVGISYFNHGAPTFTLPPDELSHLRLFHGSCRKPHDAGRDALAIVDDLINRGKQSPRERPHQLFLTGDQIYAEEVMDPMLWLVTDAATALLGWSEVLPDGKTSPADWLPGRRADLMKDHAGLKTHGSGQRRSHLIGLGEYAAMYLFAWSQVLWPPTLPLAKDVATAVEHRPRPGGGGPTDAEKSFIDDLRSRKGRNDWNGQLTGLDEFAMDLPKVRCVLANVPTYMIFDDHDVTDDWFLNRWWSINVLTSKLGKRFIQNALLSYAVFQAWGNDPQQFASGPGKAFLDHIETSFANGPDQRTRDKLDHYLGLPPPALGGASKTRDDHGELVFNRDETLALKWHYVIDGPKHQVIVLDTRTWRGYPPAPRNARDPAALMSPTAFQDQLVAALKRPHQGIEATIVVAPTNPVGIHIIDWVQFNMKTFDDFDAQRKAAEGREPVEVGVNYLDNGDAWNFHEVAFARLLSRLFEHRNRVVLLSGDIHFGYAVRLSYWARRSFEASSASTEPQRGVMAQLTSSAFKNADGVHFLTKVIHAKAKVLLADPPQEWAGWNDWPGLLHWIGKGIVGKWFREPLPDTIPVVRRIDGETYAVTEEAYQPDWRYRLEFVRRKPAPGFTRPAVIVTAAPAADDRTGWLETYKTMIRVNPEAVWGSPWFQGPIIVGLHNVGLITFEPEPADKPVVNQDLYFWPAGNATAYMVDRYRVSLELDPAPPPMTVRSFS